MMNADIPKGKIVITNGKAIPPEIIFKKNNFQHIAEITLPVVWVMKFSLFKIESFQFISG